MVESWSVSALELKEFARERSVSPSIESAAWIERYVVSLVDGRLSVVPSLPWLLLFWRDLPADEDADEAAEEQCPFSPPFCFWVC